MRLVVEAQVRRHVGGAGTLEQRVPGGVHPAADQVRVRAHPELAREATDQMRDGPAQLCRGGLERDRLGQALVEEIAQPARQARLRLSATWPGSEVGGDALGDEPQPRLDPELLAAIGQPGGGLALGGQAVVQPGEGPAQPGIPDCRVVDRRADERGGQEGQRQVQLTLTEAALTGAGRPSWMTPGGRIVTVSPSAAAVRRSRV
jgi:hypothetical protein